MAKVVTRRYVVCPACDEGQFWVDHLEAGRGFMPPWYCNECGAGIVIRRTSVDEFDAQVTDKKKLDRSILLRIPPQTKPIYLLVKGMDFEGEGREPRTDDSDRYFYEEHTCPTNYLHDTASIMIDGDTDPHGIAEFMASEPGDPSSDDSSAESETIRRMVAKIEAIDTDARPALLLKEAVPEWRCATVDEHGTRCVFGKGHTEDHMTWVEGRMRVVPNVIGDEK